MLKATVILLPLLGITWVFGILAVNQESSVFAWIFTIFNSLQVLASYIILPTTCSVINLSILGNVNSIFPCDQK